LKFRAYKLPVGPEDNTHPRKEFTLEMLSHIEEDEIYLDRLCLSDEATFHVCGTVQQVQLCMGK